MAKNKGAGNTSNQNEQNTPFPTETTQQQTMTQQNRQNSKKGSPAQNKGGGQSAR